MNNKIIVASLSKIANELDTLGKFDEANEVTSVMVKVSQYSGLKTDSSAGRAVGVTTPPPPATGAGSAVATPGYIAVNDSEVYKDYMEIIELQLENGFPNLASDAYLKGLKKLKSDENKMKFTKQWERALAKHKVGRGGEKPVGKTSPVAPTEPQVSDKVYSETENALNRWVNKAENIYKAWSTKNPAARDTPSAIRLIEDIRVYLQEMKFKVPTGSPRETAIQSRIDKISKMMADMRSGVNMPTPAMPTSYGNVPGYPAKGPNPFDTGKRLTGPQLRNQADKEIRGI